MTNLTDQSGAIRPSIYQRIGMLLMLIGIVLLQGCSAVAMTGAAVTNDRRTLGTVVEDRSLPKRAIKLINEQGQLDVFDRIQVDSYNEVLLLTGEVDSATTADRIEKLVSSLPKANRVVNEIEVTEKASWFRRRRDGMLATRVKTSLVGIKDEQGKDLKGFNPTRIKISVAHGNVYLMGLVSRFEAERAADRAANVRGVKRVIKVFDYLD